MTRRVTVGIACAGLALLLVLDLSTSRLKPYAAPALFALGSGAAPTGGFCGAPPPGS